MLWYTSSDLESEADDEVKQEALRNRRTEWARNDVSGKPNEGSLQRLSRILERRQSVNTQTSPQLSRGSAISPPQTPTTQRVTEEEEEGGE